MSQFFSIDTWFTHWYVLVFQPARVPLYIGYFVLGIIAYLNGWFTAEGYKPRLVPWSGLWVVSGLLYLGNRLSPSAGQSPFMIEAENVMLFNAFCLSSLMAGAALFQRYVNGTGRFWKSLAASSYGIYYIHPLILYPFAYIFVGIAIPLYLKATVVIVVGILLSWAISALVLRKAPILRQVF
jgi:glucan biosynthesis protein C